LTDIDLSIGNKRSLRQDAKSNAAQDDEQHNAALRRRNHKKKQKEKLDMCENCNTPFCQQLNINIKSE